MQKELANEIHKQLMRTFRNKSRKGYCWLLAKFGTTQLERIDEAVGRSMLECLEAKDAGIICLVHGRVHEGHGVVAQG